mgnify:CR=1 FL=1
MADKLPFKAKKHNDIILVDIDSKWNKGWEQWVLLSSDRHWDNVKSNRRLQKHHLEQAKERKALIVDLGDLFCLMQGKYDPRSSKSSIRPEHNVTHYLDAVIDTGVDYFKPYADNFVMVGTGNHEASVSRRCETDITSRFVEALQTACPTSTVQRGGITGFVKLKFNFKNSKQSFTYLIDYHHGYGGGGPVTKNVIQANRRAVYSDADIVCQGHVHDTWQFPITKRTVSNAGKILHKTQWHLQVPSYKDHYGKGKENWENIKGMPPKPLGCVWLRFYWDKHQVNDQQNSKRVNFERHIDIVDYGA